MLSSKHYPPVQPLPKEEKEHARLAELQKLFLKTYSEEPSFFVRVPGRVNLIGEHIDYCGYSVCPMAIQQNILIAAGTARDSVLQLTNIDPKHADFQCDINNISIEVEKGVAPGWHNYFLCGVKGILEIMPNMQMPIGIKCAVSGNIPLASGLSSSSALVSAAALVTAYANRVSLNKLEIAALCAKCERYIGTQGGGMDQAIAFLATPGSAKHIKFNPLQSEDVNLPDDAVFVIAQSLAVLNKAATADFNQRVAECQLASQLIAKSKGLKWELYPRLADLQKALGASLEHMVELVTDIFHEKPYTNLEICHLLEVTEDQMSAMSVTNSITHMTEFKLRQRALHVFQEANRVKSFCEICKNEENNAAALQKLGDLMKKSHVSLQQLYECSHPQLDHLVALGEGVALGSRLTGAGWGGCTVTLTTKGNAKMYIKLLKEKFYASNPLASNMNVDSLVFATSPGAGAVIYKA